MSTNTIKTEQQSIEDYRRVESFLADPAVKEAIAGVRDKFYAEFKASNSPADRESAWARSRALDDLADELIRIMDNGKRALAARARQEKMEEAARASRPPRK